MSKANKTNKQNKATATTKKVAKASGNSDRIRKAAIDEIQARIDAPTTDNVPTQTPRPNVGPTGDAAKGPTKKATGAKGAKTKAPAAGGNATAIKAKRMSGLDAAALILADADKPMRCIDILAEIQARGLWRTNGKTPEATLYAAIVREISAKNGQARFKKTDRGHFARNN